MLATIFRELQNFLLIYAINKKISLTLYYGRCDLTENDTHF